MYKINLSMTYYLNCFTVYKKIFSNLLLTFNIHFLIYFKSILLITLHFDSMLIKSFMD